MISDENDKVFYNCIDMSLAQPDDLFVLYPVMNHFQAGGEDAAPHLRTIVKKVNETETLAHQDVTYDQWNQGKVMT